MESGKWVGKVYAPVNGEIVGSNEELETDPELINQDC
ncbi:MAG: glycine cleavage system protein H, partial [Candidatus Cloacimonadota bacterium]|nr:glycine cleavage system protein H [Candidatus Cloacimonadota bacterium]